MATTPPSGEHPVPERHDESHDNRLVYALVGVLIGALLLVGFLAYDQANDNKVAKQKAAQLEQLFQRLGLPNVPDEKVLARSLGTDGGAVCDTSDHDLTKAILDQQLSAGGGGVGARPIITDKNILNAELAIIAVYCPDKAQEFKDAFEDYDLDDVIKN
jgi:hypothetical protein